MMQDMVRPTDDPKDETLQMRVSKAFLKSIDDWRRKQPRFQKEAFDRNLANRQAFFAIAERKGCTAAQLALAWVQMQGNDVFPIPGTKTASRVVENASAMAVSLTAEEMREIEAVSPEPEGDRYEGMTGTFNSRF